MVIASFPLVNGAKFVDQDPLLGPSSPLVWSIVLSIENDSERFSTSKCLHVEMYPHPRLAQFGYNYCVGFST